MKTTLLVTTVLTSALFASAQTQPTPPIQAVGGKLPVPVQASAQTSVLILDAHTLEGYRLALLTTPDGAAKGSAGATFVDYGSYKIQLSVRTRSGGAEVHAHWDDVMTVEQGSATLITGGTVVGSKTDADGETHGTKIEGGHSQTISPGDVLTVRAGTPHQLILEPGVVYGAIVIKIHEP